MKFVKLALLALLGASTMLGVGVTQADAGKKGKNAHQGGSSGKVHIDSKVSSKNLRAVSKKLKGHQKEAVMHELDRREQILTDRKAAKAVGTWLGTRTDIEDHIIGLGVMGTGIGKRKGGSGH